LESKMNKLDIEEIAREAGRTGGKCWDERWPLKTTNDGLVFYAAWLLAYRNIDAPDVYEEGAAFLTAFAVRHYENGWDVFVETIAWKEIVEWLALPTTPDDCNEIRAAAVDYWYLDAYVDRRNDALAAGGLETTKFHYPKND
jgi:hypothetical protein